LHAATAATVAAIKVRYPFILHYFSYEKPKEKE